MIRNSWLTWSWYTLMLQLKNCKVSEVDVISFFKIPLLSLPWPYAATAFWLPNVILVTTLGATPQSFRHSHPPLCHPTPGYVLQKHPMKVIRTIKLSMCISVFFTDVFWMNNQEFIQIMTKESNKLSCCWWFRNPKANHLKCIKTQGRLSISTGFHVGFLKHQQPIICAKPQLQGPHEIPWESRARKANRLGPTARKKRLFHFKPTVGMIYVSTGMYMLWWYVFI